MEYPVGRADGPSGRARIVRANAAARLGRLMAGPLAAVERFFERIFERPAARLFQARVGAVQIQRGLERAMENDRRVHARQAYAPSQFRVLLNETDASALDGERETLVRQLAEQVRIYARAHDYVLLARPHVELHGSAAVPAGDVRVYAAPVVLKSADQRVGKVARPSTQSPPTGPEATSQNTSTFAVPAANAPHAQLAVRSVGQPVSRVPVRGATVRIGRALDNDVVIADEKVSRHHGQIGNRLGMLVYTDLGSTNGSYLHGSTVSEIALGPGDVLQLGGSTVTIEPAT